MSNLPAFEIYTSTSWRADRRHEPDHGYATAVVVNSTTTDKAHSQVAWHPMTRNVMNPDKHQMQSIIEFHGALNALRYFIGTHTHLLDAENPVDVVVLIGDEQFAANLRDAVSANKQVRRTISSAMGVDEDLWNSALGNPGVRVTAMLAREYRDDDRIRACHRLASTKRKDIEKK